MYFQITLIYLIFVDFSPVTSECFKPRAITIKFNLKQICNIALFDAPLFDALTTIIEEIKEPSQALFPVFWNMLMIL